MIKLTDIAIINPENIGSEVEINYIDIASVGSGEIIEIKNLKSDFPSRAKRKIMKGDIIISTVRPNLKTFALVDIDIDNLVCSTGFVVIRPKNTEYKDILYHILTSNKAFRFYEKNCEGGNYPAFKSSILNNFEINELKSIKKSLNVLSKQNIMINKLRNLLEKIEIRNQYYADKLLSGELRLTRNGLELKNNEDYEYDKIKISDICQISTGKKDANEGSENGLYEFFTCSLENKKINSYSYDEEAILITGNGDPGVCKYFNGKFDAYQRVYILRNIQINPKYFYYILKNYFKDSIQNSKIGGVIQYIRLNDISDFEFKYPKNEDINTILVFLDKLKDEKEKVEKLLKLEEQRFEWLSDMLLSGEYIIED